MKSLLYSLSAVCIFVGLSCSNEKDDFSVEKKQDKNSATVRTSYDSTEGVVGVFLVPEMTTLSLLDSADAKDMAFKLAKDYSVLEEEAAAIGAQTVNAPGVINYNNDPKNFKFECLLPLKTMPAKDPQRCKIVVLEATKMLVYNHYGPYEKLLDAYDHVRIYCGLHALKQNGPMREFYLSDMDKEQDPAKWLTRIMVPVE